MSYGCAYWRFLHYFALNNAGRDLIKQLPPFLPDDEWRAEWVDPTNDEDLVVWSKDLHNKVNKKLGRYDKWDLTDFDIAHKNVCDFCENSSVHLFPWGFIHKVAEIGGTTALPFLKAFDASFPCPHCEDKFFTDEPNDGENVLDWTIRHHNRINIEKGLPTITWNIPTATNDNSSSGNQPIQ